MPELLSTGSLTSWYLSIPHKKKLLIHTPNVMNHTIKMLILWQMKITVQFYTNKENQLVCAYPLRCTTAYQWLRFASSAHQFPEVWRRVWQVDTDVNTTCEVYQGLRRSSRIHVRVGTTHPDTNGCEITNTDIRQMSLWEKTLNEWETIHCFSILGIGFLQQSRPELIWVFGVNEDQSPIDCW